MTNKNKRSQVVRLGAKERVLPSLTTPILPQKGNIVKPQKSFYNDLLARLADLERKGAIIDARLAELDVFYTGDLDAETEQVR